MYNVEFEVQGDHLIIRVDLSQELGVSSSGKSVIIATTGGNVAVGGWEAVKGGVNFYRPQPAGRPRCRSGSQWEGGEHVVERTCGIGGFSGSGGRGLAVVM